MGTGYGQLGEGVGQGIQFLFKMIMDKKKDANADDLVNQLEEQLRQDASPKKETPMAPQLDEPPSGDPLEEVLRSLRSEVGEDDNIVMAPSGVAVGNDSLARDIAERKELDYQMREMSVMKGSGLTTAQAYDEADNIYDLGTPENLELRNRLKLVGDITANRMTADIMADRINGHGGNITAEQVRAMPPEAVAQMRKNLTELAVAPDRKTQVVNLQEVIGGKVQFKKQLIDSLTGNAIADLSGWAPAPVQRTQDVNATHIAKATMDADTSLRHARDFGEAAAEIIQTINPTTIKGGAIGWVRGADNFIRTTTSMIRNQLNLADADGSNSWDPESLDANIFKGVTSLDDRLHHMLGQDANLRSLYAHLAIMFFTSKHPHAKSMSQQNLKNTMTVLGANIGDPSHMKQVIRNIANQVIDQAAKNSAGLPMNEWDDQVDALYGEKYPIDIRKQGLRPDSRYYLSDNARFSLNPEWAENIERPGDTVEEFLAAADGQILMETWYDAKTGTALTWTEIQDKIDKSDFPKMGPEHLNAAATNSLAAGRLEELLGIINHPIEMAPALRQDSDPITIISQENLRIMMQSLDSSGQPSPKLERVE